MPINNINKDKKARGGEEDGKINSSKQKHKKESI